MNLLLVFFLLFAVRLASVFIVQTWYVPDEYWQTLEVAHKLTFGYGYLTWEWVQGIRSYIYPLFIAGVYKILALLDLDSTHLLVLLPRILQATITAFSDYRFYIWMGRKKWALFLIIVPWFWFYTGSRTLGNTLETSLTTIALSYFPWHSESSVYLWPAALCCYMRPTAALIWAPLCIYHIKKSRISAFELILKRFLVTGILVAAICISVDTYLHGKLIVTPYEFLKYNIFNNIGSFYGTHPWYWYFTVGLPTVLGVNTVPFIFGVIKTLRYHDIFPERKYLLITIFISLIALSSVEHKEFRFVTSLLPLCLYIIADTLTQWSYKASKTMLWLTAFIIVFGNAIPAWYLGTIHQKGQIEVMPHLQEIARVYNDENNNRASILFLMPCHSTPYYSHIHENVTMRFLTCEPNLNNIPNYVDEAEMFFNSPLHWIRSHVPSYPRTAMPSHVVLFEPLANKIDEFLLNYKVVHRIKNAEVNKYVELQQHVQTRTGKNIVVYQRLRAGEENTFNRQEYKKELPSLDEGDDGDDFYEVSQPNEIAGNDIKEHNLFN